MLNREKEITSGQEAGVMTDKLNDWRTNKIVDCNCKAWF